MGVGGPLFHRLDGEGCRPRLPDCETDLISAGGISNEAIREQRGRALGFIRLSIRKLTQTMKVDEVTN